MCCKGGMDHLSSMVMLNIINSEESCTHHVSHALYPLSLY